MSAAVSCACASAGSGAITNNTAAIIHVFMSVSPSGVTGRRRRTLPGTQFRKNRGIRTQKKIGSMFHATDLSALSPKPSSASVPPGHEALDQGDSREVVVNHRHHQHQQHREPREEHLLFDAETEVAAREPFEGHDEDMSAVEHWNRQEIEQPEVEA